MPFRTALLTIASQTYAFSRDGVRITNQQGDLQIKRYEIGELMLPTGQLVACDALAIDEPQPFEVTVPPGRYPLSLSVARVAATGDERVATALLRFSIEEPRNWTIATVPGQDVTKLVEGHIFGYNVETGTGSLMDYAAAKWLDRRMQLGDGYVDELFQQQHQTYMPNRSWVIATLDETTNLNCAIFSSGLGDGRYASYWGYGASGRVACLMTDFDLLVD